jgi:hypothetical protein
MSVTPPSFAELVDEAATVVRGRVTAVQSRKVLTPDGEAIKTFVTFAVDKTLKGAPDRSVTLSFLGGQVGDERWEVAGMPEFQVGAEEFLFVTADAQVCPLVGAMHGRYRIVAAEKSGRAFVARNDHAPLTGVNDVAEPMEHDTARIAATNDGLSPEAFEQAIATEVARSTRATAR